MISLVINIPKNNKYSKEIKGSFAMLHVFEQKIRSVPLIVLVLLSAGAAILGGFMRLRR